MIKKLLALWLLLSAAPLAAQQQTLYQPRLIRPFLFTYTVSTLPAAGSAGRLAVVNDALTAGSCTVGGGSAVSFCRDNGSAWVPLGDGGNTAGPSDATYITQTASSGLSAEQALSSLSTGIAKVTTGTGVISSLAIPLIGTNGGTNNAFFEVTGPTTSTKTFTFPNASSTVLTSNAAVTVAQGGTGIASGTSGGVPYFSGSTTIASSGALTADLPVIGGGAGVAPSVGTRSGNTTQYVTTTGTQTSGDCVSIDANGNHVANGAACSGSGAPSTATYITQTADGTLSNEQALSALSTGIVQVTTGTGVLSSLAIPLAGTNGGTANAFFEVSGPTTSTKTFTFPNASSTVLTSDAAVTVPQGGTGIASGTSGGVPYFSGSTTIASSAALTANLPVIGGGAGVAPSVGTRSGNTTAFVTTTGAQTSGDCVSIDANGNHVANGASCGAGGGAPTNATYITQTADGTLSNEQALGSLATGYMKVTTTTGVVSSQAVPIPVADGGTGLTSGTSGGVPYYSASGTLASSGALTANLPVIGGGAGVSPAVGTRSGNTTQYVTTTGTQTSGDCVSIDANGNHVANGSSCGAGGGAPTNATYITQTADGTLSNEQALSALSTGIVKVTTTTGVLSSLAIPLTVDNGGTGIASGTSGGVPYFSGSTTIASSGALTANLPVIGGGAGVAPTVGTRSGNTTAYVTTTGTQTSGDCVKIDANGNHVANGSACGGGSGAPTDADYWVETANGSLSAEVVVGTTGITTAAYGSRQAAAKAGRIFLPNDSFYLERDTGSTWARWGPIFPMTPPVDGDFSWFNQGTASISTTNGSITLSTPAETAANRYRVKTAPSAPWTVTAWFLVTGSSVGPNFGLGFLQSSDNKNHVFVCGTTFASQKRDGAAFNSNYTFSTIVAGAGSPFGVPFCIRISDDNTNRKIEYSWDGINFLLYHTVGRTDFMTADRIVWWGASDVNFNSAFNLLSWKQE